MKSLQQLVEDHKNPEENLKQVQKHHKNRLIKLTITPLFYFLNKNCQKDEHYSSRTPHTTCVCLVRHAHLIKAVLTRLSLGLLHLLLCNRDSFCGFAWHSGLQQKSTIHKHYKFCKNQVFQTCVSLCFVLVISTLGLIP